MKRPSATLIGIFVLGALALIAAAILFFGSGTLFKQRFTAVSYFRISSGTADRRSGHLPRCTRGSGQIDRHPDRSGSDSFDRASQHGARTRSR